MAVPIHKIVCPAHCRQVCVQLRRQISNANRTANPKWQIQSGSGVTSPVGVLSRWMRWFGAVFSVTLSQKSKPCGAKTRRHKWRSSCGSSSATRHFAWRVLGAHSQMHSRSFGTTVPANTPCAPMLLHICSCNGVSWLRTTMDETFQVCVVTSAPCVARTVGRHSCTNGRMGTSRMRIMAYSGCSDTVAGHCTSPQVLSRP